MKDLTRDTTAVKAKDKYGYLRREITSGGHAPGIESASSRGKRR